MRRRDRGSKPELTTTTRRAAAVSTLHTAARAIFFVRSWPGGGRIAADEEVQEDVKLLIAKVIEHFGGETGRLGKGNRLFYQVGDGKVLNVKYSKRHSGYYWFGFHASLWEDIGKAGVTHVVFILLPDGFVTVPVAIMREYIAEAGVSPKRDRTVRHYHVLISADTKPELFHHGKAGRITLKPHYTKFEA
jgi:hypothetical protein